MNKSEKWSKMEVRLAQVPFWYDQGHVVHSTKSNERVTLAEVLATATQLREQGQALLRKAEEVFSFLDKQLSPDRPVAEGKISIPEFVEACCHTME